MLAVFSGFIFNTKFWISNLGLVPGFRMSTLARNVRAPGGVLSKEMGDFGAFFVRKHYWLHD